MKKVIAITVLIAFIGIGVAWAMEQGSPQFLEKAGTPIIKKHKEFLWLIVGVGVVAVGIASILLLGKKKNDPTPNPTPTNTYINGVLTVSGVRYELASIPAGTFQMGSNSLEAYSDERTLHTVQISKSFWLGRTEVTQGLWVAVMGSLPSHINNFEFSDPVAWVSWDDCQSFITKLNQMFGVPGRNYFRLPTEAEWEYSCRAGTTGDRYGDIDAIAWYYSNSGGETHPVGQKQANGWGLFDMLGNVEEWCQDWYGAYSSGFQIDPTGPGSGTYRVIRGGSWTHNTGQVRSAYRYHNWPNSELGIVGFRLARTNE